MMMSAAALLVAVGIGALWMTRGFFSALIHLLCTVVAGAIAFAVWEPLAYMLLGMDTSGGITLFLHGSAWAIALFVPFAVSLAILRVVVDSLVRSNVKVHPAAEYVGGGICGLLAGVVTSGILVLSIGFLRAEDRLFGYKPIDFAGAGYVQRTEKLWIPTDKIVAAMYGTLSQTTLRTENNLGTLYPDLDIVPTSMRMNFRNGLARNTVKPSDFILKGYYTVGEGKNVPLKDLLSDRWQASAQVVNDLDGASFPAGSYLVGVGVVFNSGAREKAEPKGAWGNAQVRMVAENDDGEVKTLFPIAAVLQAEGTKPVLGRYRFDSKEVFFAGAGASSDTAFGIEFLVPAGYRPKAMYVKGVRVMFGEGALDKPKAQLATSMERDGAVMAGAVASLMGVSGAGGGQLDTSTATTIKTGDTSGAPDETGLRAANDIGFTIHKTTVRKLVVDDDGNFVKEGEQTFTAAELQSPPLEQALQVRRFAVPSDRVLVQVDVSLNKKHSWLGGAAASVDDILPPLLVDTNGIQYQAIGYIYKNSIDGNTTVRYNPSQPIRALKEIPTLSRSRPNDRLKLVFEVTLGAKLNHFALGGKVIASYKPTVLLDRPQGGR